MRALIKTRSISHQWRLKTPCHLCAQYHHTSGPLCTDCHNLLIPLGPACKQCATPLPDMDIIQCGYCIQHPPPLDAVFCPYRFEEPLRTLLHHFKYHESLHLTLCLAKKMLLTPPLFTSQKTCLIPVPLHKKRLQKRGFNQAALLAQALSKTLHQPCLLQAIQKIKNTQPQAALDAKRRLSNIKDTFKIKPVPYPEVILIDDLITTGSTANELAYQLKRQGIKRVSLWCIAKTCLD